MLSLEALTAGWVLACLAIAYLGWEVWQLREELRMEVQKLKTEQAALLQTMASYERV